MAIARVYQAPPPVIDQSAVSAFFALFEIVKDADTYKKRIEALKKATDDAAEAVANAKAAAEEAAEAERDKLNKQLAAHDAAVAKERAEINTEKAKVLKMLEDRTTALEQREKVLLDAVNKLDADRKLASEYSLKLKDTEVALNRRTEALIAKETEVNARVAKLDALRGAI